MQAQNNPVAWKQIPDFPDYAVSTDGQVKRITPDSYGRFAGITMATFVDRGYRVTCLRDFRGIRRSRPIHVLMAAAFIGPRPHGKVVRHLDGIRAHNLIDNLCYGTSKQNGEDMVRHGKSRPGPLARDAKLCWDDVHNIRETALLPGTITSLAKKYGVARKTIFKVINRVTWRNEPWQLV